MNQNLNPENKPGDEQKQPPSGEPAHYVSPVPHKKERTVTLSAAIGALVTAVILTVLATFGLTVKIRQPSPGVYASGETQDAAPFSELTVIDKLFHSLSVKDLDDEAIGTALLKAYVDATGDRYAEYMTPAEYDDQKASQNGEMCGIGVSVVKDDITPAGETEPHEVIIVANVYKDSPAEKAGFVPGDAIVKIGTGESAVAVNDIGYEKAIDLVRGEAGSEVSFIVWRKKPGGEAQAEYQTIEITATRQKLITPSVLYHVCDTDPRVGIVRITGFDNTTAKQFNDAMNDLIANGCSAFVFDLRNNGGGLLTAVEDVLAFFLQKDDVMLHTRDKRGNKETQTVTVTDGKVTSGSGKYTEADVGKYRDYPIAVLVNENTASAAELFTANIRDYQLGAVVGTKTYGKGTMQTTYDLATYGISGALKLTTRYYDPPLGENYDGKDKGITPDRVVEMSDEAKAININLLPDEKDNQLQEAISTLFGQ